MPTPKEKAFHTQKHVNKLDESQGVNLKKPKETVDEKCEYYEKVMAYKYSMTKLVSMLNGIDSDKYASDSKIFGLEVRKIKINSKFKAISKWFDENDYDVNDVRFKARYITYIGTWVVEHIEDLADKCYSFNNDGKFIEYHAELEHIENTSCMFLAGGAVDLISRTNAFAVGEGTGTAAGQGYIIGGVIFFIICFPLSMLASHWEKKLKMRDVATIKVRKKPDDISDAELDMIIKDKGGENNGRVDGQS